MLSRPLTPRDIPLILFFVLSWAVITWSADYSSPGPRIPVGATIPDDFPVLVISSTGESLYAKIVPNDSLEAYVSGLKSYSFLVPRGKTRELNQQVARGLGDDDRFEVSELPNGKQLLKVVWHWGGGCYVETGWYIAERRSFIPKYHQSNAIPILRVLLYWGPFTLLANILLWVVGRFVYRRIRRRRVP